MPADGTPKTPRDAAWPDPAPGRSTTTTSTDERVPSSGGARADPPAPPPDFDGIVRRFETPLLKYVRCVADPADADDLVQEAFIRLHRQLQKPGGVRSLEGFLFTTVHHLALDSLRRGRVREDTRRQAVERDPRRAERGGEALAALVKRAAARRAMDELMLLPIEERRVIFLKIVQELSLREIAEITGQAFSSVAYKLSAGLAKIARRLQDAGVV